jgi:hypothetical protein
MMRVLLNGCAFLKQIEYYYSQAAFGSMRRVRQMLALPFRSHDEVVFFVQCSILMEQ